MALKESTIKLNTALEMEGLPAIPTITLKEPTAGQMMKVQHLSGFAQITALIAEVTGIQPLVVQKMGLLDYRRCAEFFDDMFRPAPNAD